MTTAFRVCTNCNAEKPVEEFHERFAKICAVCLVKEKFDQKSQVFECPCCHTELQFTLKLKVTGVQPYVRGSNKAALLANQSNRQSLSTNQSNHKLSANRTAFLSEVKASGLIKVFEQCIEQIGSDSKPSNIEEYFLKFINTAQEYKISAYARGWLVKEYGTTNLRFQHAFQIIAVIVDDKLRSFIPTHLLEGRTHRIGNTTTRSDASMGQFVAWVKTRHGYVVGKGYLYEEMKRQSAGSFVIS